MCYFCGKTGHLKRDCRSFLKGHQQRDNSNNNGRNRPFNVPFEKSKDHSHFQCFTVKAELNNIEIRVIVDTGAGMSIIGGNFFDIFLSRDYSLQKYE